MATNTLCRDLGHAWKSRNANKTRTGFWEMQVCTRCSAKRERNYDRRGYILDSKMVWYPEGYLRPRGSGRMTAADKATLRMERLSA